MSDWSDPSSDPPGDVDRLIEEMRDFVPPPMDPAARARIDELQAELNREDER